MILKWGEVIIFYENIHHPCFFKLFAPFLLGFLTKNVCFQDTVGTDKEHQLDFQETGNLLFPHIWHIFCTFCQYEIIFGQMINISIWSCKIEFKMGNKYFPSFSCFCFYMLIVNFPFKILFYEGIGMITMGQGKNQGLFSHFGLC